MSKAALIKKDSQHRAYSLLTVKAVEEGDEDRVIRGIATTPEVDRVGDVIEPLGVKFRNPLPLLWMHRHDSPVGNVKFSKATDDGIEFEAKIAKITEPGILKDLVDMAWQAVKAKLVRGVSIGFRALEYSFIEGGGIRFSETEVFELSLVTIPANSSALITSAKSLSQFDERTAASGTDASRRNSFPGVSGSVRITKPGDTPMKKTIAERLADLQATRDDKMKRITEITEKASEAGRTKDAAEREEFDTLKSEVESLDAEIEDLKAMEKMEARKAAPVDAEAIRKAKAPASPSTADRPGHVQVKHTQKLEPGIRVARYAKCLAIAAVEQQGGRFVTADQVAKSLYQHDEVVNGLFQKAAIAPALTSTDGWAGNLISDEGGAFADFIEFLRPQTILGAFGANGVPALRRVPFRTPLVGQGTGGAGYWVGEGSAKPLTSFDFTRTTLGPLKVANIAVASMEVLRDSSPSAETLIRDSLVAALRERLDIDFIDPAKAVDAGVSPASITNGASTVASSGTDADAVRADIKALFATFIAANNAPTSGVWIMPATTALALSLMQNPLGQSEFPGINMRGGNLFGLPVIVSEYVPSDTSGAVVALVNASDIYMADDGGFNVSVSREASLQMDSEPTNPTVAATVLVSLWQRNLVGFLAERTINWARRRTGSVAYLTGVLWGSA